MNDAEEPARPAAAVFLLEPHCRGMEHASFNACLATALLCSHSRIVFAGEASHLVAVKEVLDSARPGLSERIEYRPLALEPRSTRGLLSSLRDAWLTFGAVTYLWSPGRCEVVLATGDSASASLLKVLVLLRGRRCSAVMLLHEALATLSRRRYRKLKYWSLRLSLSAPIPRSLSLLTLVAGTKDEVERLLPAFAGRVQPVHMPTLLSSCVPTRPATAPQLRIGFVGGGREAKGLDLFTRIAEQVRAVTPEVEFELIGAVPPHLLHTLPPSIRATSAKLPLRDFVARISSLSYVLWVGAPDHYRIVGSASLADSLGMGIPALCLRGRFVDSLFEAFGNIGHRCEDGSALVSTIVAIAKEWPGHTDAHQCSLSALRAALQPEALAETLARLLGTTADVGR